MSTASTETRWAAARAFLVRRGRTLANLMPLVTLLILIIEWNGIPGQPRDTAAYHQAARIAGGDADTIYSPLPPPGPLEITGSWPYVYPPVLAAFLSMLPESSYRAFDRGWLIANVLAFWLLALALARTADGKWSLRGTLDWSAALFVLPGAWFSIHFGNIDLMILALLAWGLLLPAAAGGAFAIAAAFKITPVWPLLTLVLRRPLPTVLASFAAALLSAAASLIAFGYTHSLALFDTWLTRVLPSLSQGQFWGESFQALQRGDVALQDYFANLSLSFLPVQLAVMGGWDYAGGPLPGLVRAWLTGFGIIVPALVAFALRHRALNVQVASVAAAALWAAPIVRPYVLPVALLVLATLREERRSVAPSPGRGCAKPSNTARGY